MTSLKAHVPAIFDVSESQSAALRVSEAVAARRFVRTAVMAYVAGLSLLAALSTYANPWGNFGQMGFLEPQEYNDRLVKANHLDALDVCLRPQILIFGSSSLMSMRAADITAASGRTAFNNYVSGGRADDYLCMLRHLVDDLNYRPEFLIVGIETWTFAPPTEQSSIIPGARRMLINVPQWIRHHPQGHWYRRAWARMVDLFSHDHLSASWRVLFRLHLDRSGYSPLGKGIIAADGALIFASDDPMTLAGTRRSLADVRRAGVTSLLCEVMANQTTHRLERLRYYRFDGLWTPAVQRFEEFLSLCQKSGIKVILVRTPLHPLAWDMLSTHPGHLRNMRALDEHAQRWELIYPAIKGVVDASQVEDFGGDPDDFYDEMHCGPENSKRILAQVAAFLESR